MNDFEPYYWEGQKQTPQGIRYRICLAEHVLYAAPREDVPCEAKDGGEATMFSYSYTLMQDKETKDRPVIFAYNGGPGAASSWLHMGLLGPVLADVPGYPDSLEYPAKYTLTPNPDFLLDQYDIVLIDPVGTGWARLLDEGAASKHYSTEGDARDFADFICTWLRENSREKSPVYLFDLPEDRVQHSVLPSGHASYVGEGMAERMTAEIRAFMEQDGK